jgi:large subunit ribosomal protein L4
LFGQIEKIFKMKVKVYNLQSKTNTQTDLNSAIFACKTNEQLLSVMVDILRANSRKAIASTKTRKDVRGGGRKPWRQKGTGNARAGSSRSPLWRGGGIVFGPQSTKVFLKKYPRKVARQAIKMALSQKAKDNKIIIVKEFKLEAPKTKKVQDILEKLPIEEGSLLVVLAGTNLNFELATANLSYIKTVLVSGINLIDLLKYDYIIFEEKALAKLQESLN